VVDIVIKIVTLCCLQNGYNRLSVFGAMQMAQWRKYSNPDPNPIRNPIPNPNPNPNPHPQSSP